MIELPEAVVLSEQLKLELKGKTITGVVTNSSPHKFAWFYENPDDYPSRLIGQNLIEVKPRSGQVEMIFEAVHLTFTDGVNLRYFKPSSKLPLKHQLLLSFDDQSTLVCSVQMYGGLVAFPKGQYQNPYYIIAGQKPTPLSDDFSEDYFLNLVSAEKPTLSTKALLATEQRIPGLGNGVLQDILYEAGIHPKRKLGTLSTQELKALYISIKNTIQQMTALGGRDTEKNIYGEPGGYPTRLSSKTQNLPCHKCGDIIHKESYMGGSIYFCATCQK